MHECTDCGKTYQSLNSLTRHAYNHRRTKQHACRTCGVAFGRKDLLSRHVQIHQRGSDAGADSNSPRSPHAAPFSHKRKRCHTACVRCAELRRKCNGQRPCDPCLQVGTICEYSRRTGRLSQVQIDDHSAGTIGTSVDVRPEQQLQHPCESSPEDVLGAADREQSTQVELPVDGQMLTHEITQNLASDAAGGFEFDSDGDPNPLWSWPWIHESLYLPMDESSRPTVSDLPIWKNMNRSSTTNQPTATHLLPSTQSTAINEAIRQEPYVSPYDFNNTTHRTPRDGPTLSSLLTSESQRPISAPNTVQLQPSLAEDGDPQQQVVHDLVTYAAMTNLFTTLGTDHGQFWSSMSPKVFAAFQLESFSPVNAMQDLVLLYLEHFGVLWPLLSHQNLDINTLHPLLYLVLTSIGAMYGGSAAVVFGTMMHNRIRTYLTVAFELDEDGGDFLWLAQARLLTQVASLYFGQPRAFTYAQHLGALLVAQGRRMGIFSAAQRNNSVRVFDRLKNANRDSERLAIWLQLEARRRLAFGIFRGDTFTSVLLNTKPLLSLQEIDLEFPTCDAVWRANPMPPQACLHMIEQDRTPSRNIRASDIYRIALDPNEALPPLDPGAHELLLFGLQRPLWQFSHDHGIFERLTGAKRPASSGKSDGQRASTPPLSHEIHPESGRLEISERKMSRMLSEYDQLLKAFSKWELALPWVKSFAHGEHDNISLFSGLVLFHLGYLRLFCPVEDVHSIQYRLAKSNNVDEHLVQSVRRWASTPHAEQAVDSAGKIWSLIKSECERRDGTRVKFNLLAFIGLHHSAAALWCYAGARAHEPTQGGRDGPLVLAQGSRSDLPITPEGIPIILASFVDLFHQISSGRWSSFAEAATALAAEDFPESGVDGLSTPS